MPVTHIFGGKCLVFGQNKDGSGEAMLVYRMTHKVLSTFKLVYRQLNGIFLSGNFALAFSRLFVNSGQKDPAKFQNFDPCTMVRVSKRVLFTCFLGHTL
jgi:hypothetical protein